MNNDFISKDTVSNNTTKKQKIANILKKILIYTVIAVGVILLLVVAYQIFVFLFTLLILIIAWLCPRRWR